MICISIVLIALSLKSIESETKLKQLCDIFKTDCDLANNKTLTNSTLKAFSYYTKFERHLSLYKKGWAWDANVSEESITFMPKTLRSYQKGKDKQIDIRFSLSQYDINSNTQTLDCDVSKSGNGSSVHCVDLTTMKTIKTMKTYNGSWSDYNTDSTLVFDFAQGYHDHIMVMNQKDIYKYGFYSPLKGEMHSMTECRSCTVPEIFPAFRPELWQKLNSISFVIYNSKAKEGWILIFDINCVPKYCLITVEEGYAREVPEMCKEENLKTIEYQCDPDDDVDNTTITDEDLIVSIERLTTVVTTPTASSSGFPIWIIIIIVLVVVLIVIAIVVFICLKTSKGQPQSPTAKPKVSSQVSKSPTKSGSNV